MDSGMRATGAGPHHPVVAWPVSCGAVPPLADGYSDRPETAPGFASALVPGATVALVPGGTADPKAASPDMAFGKTQLAVYAAESLVRSGGVDLLVWVVAADRASILSGLAAAAEATGSGRVGNAESAAAGFLGWLSMTSHPWLVVLDDLRHAEDMDGLWPEGPAGLVLITAADPAAVPAGRPAALLPVPQLSTREALGYLMGRLTADPDQRLGAIDLVSDLRCEPAALAQASAVIARSGMSCRDYRDLYAGRRAQLAEAGGAPRSASAVTWTLSAEHAERLSPGGGAQYLLAVAALLDGHGIPGAVFTTMAVRQYLGQGQAMDPEAAWGTLLSLERAGLVSVATTTAPPIVRMSSALQAAVRAATPWGLLDQVSRAAADALLEAWPDDDPQPWLATELRSCTISLWQATGDLLWAGGCHPLLERAGRSMDTARLTGPAVSYWRGFAATSDRITGSSSPSTLMAGSRLAGALLAAGQTEEAVAWAQWALAGRARVLGPDDPGTIAARTALGRALLAKGQPDAAATVLEAAAADCERVLGAEHPDTLAAREELASSFRNAGKPAEAIQLYQRTVAERERVQGSRHPDTMTTRQRLADTYLAEGRVKDAISQLKRVVADRERVLGREHLDTIRARGGLAAAYHSAGRMASALQLYEQACQGYARVLGADDPQTLVCRVNLAEAYYKTGRLGDARLLLRDTLERCERVLPPGAQLTRTVRESLTNMPGG
jgi:tetratricopeptide (TPR) repeat protein